MNKELKFYDNLVTYNGTIGANGDKTGTIIKDSLLNIQQGTQPSQRIGRKIFVKRLQMRGTITLRQMDEAGGTSDQQGLRGRLIVYCDKQTNGSIANPNDILQDSSAAGNATVPYPVTTDNYRNMEYIDRFRIIHDKTYTLNRLNMGILAATPEEQYGTPLVKSFNVGKNMNLEVVYKEVTGTIDSLQSTNIGVMWISDEALTGTDQIIVKFQFRVRYTD